jgi:hypothetical protein
MDIQAQLHLNKSCRISSKNQVDPQEGLANRHNPDNKVVPMQRAPIQLS